MANTKKQHWLLTGVHLGRRSKN